MSDKRIYGVQFSGHGSSFLPESPVCDKTWDEAQTEAFDWEMRADTIGGGAQVVTKEGICWDVEDARKTMHRVN